MSDKALIQMRPIQSGISIVLDASHRVLLDGKPEDPQCWATEESGLISPKGSGSSQDNSETTGTIPKTA